MFTIIQQQQDGSYNVIAKVADKDVAITMTGDLCNSAGVIRTVCLDSFGYACAAES